ncbi:MAG: T9SS type A sorting domain-containing protein [Bacteroidota bacterium]
MTKKMINRTLLLILLLKINSVVIAQIGAIDALDLNYEKATPEQIGLHLPVNRTLSMDSKVMIRYKKSSDVVWQTGHPLLRIHPEWCDTGAPTTPVDAFAGSIFDLIPGTTYNVELTLVEPGQSNKVHVLTTTTRALPASSSAATKTATPSNNLQTVFNNLIPGDVLELSAGTYNVNGLYLNVSGTASQPIYIRGVSRKGVIIKDVNDLILQLVNTSHIVIENLTIEGSGTDSGTNASSTGVSFWDGAVQENITLRNMDMVGVDVGIKAWERVYSILVYHINMKGNNVWTNAFIGTNLTWNDDGICLPGQGNVAFENTLHGFGDCFAVMSGTHSSGVYYYRNKITMTGDDAFEADYGTRNMAFYDNYITNCGTLLSLDPLWGGPLYCFRNICINTIRGPFKLNSDQSGFLIYNNTIVRTEGSTGWGWVQFNNGSLRNWSYRNNILIYRGSSGNFLAIESSGNSPIDFTYNAWFPEGQVWWSTSGASYGTMSAAITGINQTKTAPLFGTDSLRHKHDVMTVNNPFVPTITLGNDHLTEFTSKPIPSLLPGSSPKNTGVIIPNITDQFNGLAPDMGAIMEGRPLPKWGDDDITTSVSDNEILSGQLLIFPNPSAGIFNIHLDSEYTGEVIISVKNTLGQIIKQENLTKTNQYLQRELTLEGEARGIYFLHVQTVNELIVQQLIKLND